MGLKKRLKGIYFKIIGADDTPHRIALGFGVGIFYGVFPLVGVIFALVTAAILRANKATALAGCFVTNTWMSAALAVPSVKIGSKIFGLEWSHVLEQLKVYFGMRDIRDMLNAASRDIMLPALTGFLIVAFCFGFVGYAVSLYFALKYREKKDRKG